MNLANKRVLLTGATGGVGSLLAKSLANKGALMALVGRNHNKLNTLKNEIEAAGGKAITIEADLSKQGSPQSVAEIAKEQLGDIDVLINNAGIIDFIAIEDQSDSRIAEMINTNVTSLIQLTNAVLPTLQQKNNGHLMFIGSIFGSLGFPHYATYCASKFAVHGFSQSLRRELVDSKIGVTYVAPRGIQTPMNEANVVAMFEKTGSKMDTPETVASIIVRSLEQEKQEVFIGQPQSFLAWLNGLAPKLINLGLKKQPSIAKPFLK